MRSVSWGGFNRMADNLEQLEELRKRMVADIAHELRTPLTNLRGYFEGLKDDVVPPSADTSPCLKPRPCGWSTWSTICSS